MNKIILVLLFCPLLCAGQKVYTYGGKVLTHSGRPLTTASSTPVTPFSPADIDSLKLWLKADAGVTLNGSTVSAWADQSGNENDAVQATATNQPTFYANQINGEPTIFFETNDQLDLPSGFIYNAPNIEVFVLLKPQSVLNAGIIAPKTSFSSGIELLQGIHGYELRTNGTLKIPASASTESFMYDNSYGLTAFYYNNTATQGYYNGGILGYYGTGGASLNYNGVYSIGSYASGYYMKGCISEILIYNNTLSVSDRGKVNNYLLKKYDLFTISGSSYCYLHTYTNAFIYTDAIGLVPEGWIDDATTGWIQCQYYNQKNIPQYSLKAKAGETDRMAKDWILQGSQDGVNYTTIDTETNQTGWSDSEVRTFTIDSSDDYYYYKLVISSNNGDATYLQIQQIHLIP